MTPGELRIDADKLLGTDLDSGFDKEYLLAMRYYPSIQEKEHCREPDPEELDRQSLRGFYAGLELIS